MWRGRWWCWLGGQVGSWLSSNSMKLFVLHHRPPYFYFWDFADGKTQNLDTQHAWTTSGVSGKLCIFDLFTFLSPKDLTV